RARRPRVSGDDELLLVAALDLQPVARAAGAVGLTALLGEDAFERRATGRGVARRTRADDVIAVAHHAVRAAAIEETSQALLAHREGAPAQVPPVLVQEIEDVVR